jgi:hypothetical protein
MALTIKYSCLFRYLGLLRKLWLLLRLICLSRRFRFLNRGGVALIRNNPHRLRWKDRNGQSNTTYSTSALAVSQPSTSLWGSVRFFQVDAIIEPQSGISSFVVDWAFHSQDTLTHSDNGGGGFPLQDVALFQADESCVTPASQANPITTVFAVVGETITQPRIQLNHLLSLRYEQTWAR